MEGWDGEDENSVPTVNVSLCCYSVLHGVRGSYIQKLVWFHCNGLNLHFINHHGLYIISKIGCIISHILSCPFPLQYSRIALSSPSFSSVI